MENKVDEITLFKPFLQKGKGAYKGGKSKKEYEAMGFSVYKLSSNENPLGSSPKAMKAVQEYVHTLNEYPAPADTTFQQALEAFYKGEVKVGQFITANSGVAVLQLIANAFLGEGLESIISNPAFGPYAMFTNQLGAKVVDIPLMEPNFDLNVDGILAAITDKTRLIWVTNPNNPTGTYIPKKDIDRLINSVPDHVVVVYDEVYYQFPDKEDYTLGLPYIKAGKKVIAVNSFSKAYGLAGMRVGYAYSTPEIAAYVQQIRLPFMVNTLSLQAAMAALHDDEFIQKTVNLVHTEKAFLYKALDEMGVTYWKSQTNFFLVKPNVPVSEFTQAMLEGGIMVRPVANFGAPGCVRITFGTREMNETLIKALRKMYS